jgi:hypothetical protein
MSDSVLSVSNSVFFCLFASIQTGLDREASRDKTDRLTKMEGQPQNRPMENDTDWQIEIQKGRKRETEVD